MDEKDKQIARLKLELEKAQHEVDEVLESTKDIEAQLEEDVAQAEKQLERARKKNADLSRDLDTARRKAQEMRVEHEREVTGLRQELDNLRKTFTQTKERLRDEELKHDDLERQERIVTTSYQDLENKYHEALERNVDLESDLATKANLEVDHQRLKDELRDLKMELTVVRESTAPAGPSSTLRAIDKHHESPSPSSDLDGLGNITKQSYFIKSDNSRVDLAASISSNSGRPESRLATTNSVRNIQSLSNTIQALREKMRLAREDPPTRRPASRLSRPSGSPTSQHDKGRPASSLGMRPPTALDSHTLPQALSSSTSSLRPRTNSSMPRRGSGISASPRSSLQTTMPSPAFKAPSKLRPPTASPTPRRMSNIGGIPAITTTTPSKTTSTRRQSCIPSPLVRASSSLSTRP